MGRTATTSTRIQAFRDSFVRSRPDQLVTEEPLEIRVHGPGQEPRAVAVTMRTPGADFDLAVGHLLSEGILADLEALASVAYCQAGAAQQDYNVVTVRLRAPVHLGERTVTTMPASCGVCGKTRREEVTAAVRIPDGGPLVTMESLVGMPDTLRAAQPLFTRTGGIHAAARFTAAGELLAVREDIGRHNALDKLIGDAVRSGVLPLHDQVVLISGRVSFEIVQKAAMAGVPIVAAVSAPSSLAVETADSIGQTVVGFVREGGGNIYAHPERIAGSAAGVA